MRAIVFTDRALDRQAGRFVWLSVDTENDKNEAFLEKYPIEAYPTLLVIDPSTEKPVLRWVGSATVGQLEKLLDDGERAWLGKGTGADATLAEADRLLGVGRDEEAAAAYRKALAEATTSWPGRDRTVESLLSLMADPKSAKDCVAFARSELPKERNAHFANVAAAGVGCAAALEGAEKAPAVTEFEAAVRSAASGEPRIEMTPDDRSGLYAALVDARKESGDEAGAKKVAAEWLAFLMTEADRAPSVEARTALDSQIVNAAIACGEPARALPALERAAKELPNDYNPPARLAYVLTEIGRYDEALAAADRALLLVYGPRKLRVYSTKAGILEKKGDKDAAKTVLRDALKYAETLPKSMVSPRAVKAIGERLAKIG